MIIFGLILIKSLYLPFLHINSYPSLDNDEVKIKSPGNENAIIVMIELEGKIR